ncbi:MAG TPA: hypothetical protein VFU88_18085 [Ktedonobacterales bacterium]|nr:hypothetical protein [Ktedonobacterales bacterium]
MAGMDTDSPVLPLVILLREGGPLTLESDRLAVSGLSLPIREIALPHCHRRRFRNLRWIQRTCAAAGVAR